MSLMSLDMALARVSSWACLRAPCGCARGPGDSIASLLDDVHAVLMPLKAETFVTVACVRGGCANDVECAVAGHLPILRVRNGTVEEVT